MTCNHPRRYIANDSDDGDYCTLCQIDSLIEENNTLLDRVNALKAIIVEDAKARNTAEEIAVQVLAHISAELPRLVKHVCTTKLEDL